MRGNIPYLAEKTIFYCLIILINLIMFSMFRVVFLMLFNDTHAHITFMGYLKAFYLGFKFDLRLAIFIILPVAVVAWLPKIELLTTDKTKKSVTRYFVFIMLFLLLFYAMDAGHYAYLQTRVNASIFNFLYNPLISARMVWETYPVIQITIALCIILFACYRLILFCVNKFHTDNSVALSWRARITTGAIVGILFFLGMWGKVSQYPLRWSEAFFSTNSFTTALSLNPFLYFVDTIKNAKKAFDVNETKKYYSVIANHLNLADGDTLSYVRNGSKNSLISKKANIVVIIIESLAANKLGVFDNPMKASPFLDSLARDAILFKRFYTPTWGTARSVFTFVTGIPDVYLVKTSSRNPLTVTKPTIINAFKDYSKMYFIGGSANWGNIRAVLSHNIDGLQMYEEGDYDSSIIDVWGISDLNLLREANNVLKKQDTNKPFFAVVQTSGNHRPYTIPEDNQNFVSLEASEEEVRKYGFVSVAEYNSFRFIDHSLKLFFDSARKERYFKDTVFVIFGDHGLGWSGKPAQDKATRVSQALSSHHVPFMIYAPHMIQGGRVEETIMSELDVLPTIASITGTTYTNSSLGRNIFDKHAKNNPYAFIAMPQEMPPKIGLVGEEYYFTMHMDGSNKHLRRYEEKNLQRNVYEEFPDIAHKMEQLSFAFYHTARYLLNKK